MFTLFKTVLGLLICATVVHGNVQHPFRARLNTVQPPPRIHPSNQLRTPLAAESYDTGSFSAVGDPTLLSVSHFTTLSHPAFPNHSVRIKKANICDGDEAYTGYFDIEARHLFFFFFESKNDPDNDDVIFWTSGGPGCAGSLGLFMDFGPCKITNPNGTVHNPYSWTEKASVFFVDQPIGVGFSYADYGETVSTTEEAAKDIAAFVAIFFEHFTKFKGNAFHMASSSYGGRYIPVFASEVYDQNAKLVEAGMTPINLTSIMIGNGCTDVTTMLPSYYDMQCTGVTAPPKIGISSCVRQKLALPRCERWLKESCRDSYDAMNCRAAVDFCGAEIEEPFNSARYNPYDILKPCDGDIEETLCYPVTNAIEAYLNRPDIRTILGVDPAISGNVSACSNRVNDDFNSAGDYHFPTQYYLAALLERGIRTLLYVGTRDWICNWVGNERMTVAMEWTGQEAYTAAEKRKWYVDSEVAGLVKSVGPFTFATVHNAGHMVPYDVPKESLAMINRWLAGEEL
ncbi:Carboxypeptidase Y homolog A [Sparassis crispa]|uniref:carboxypeptidase C n=1 Tax=Sparassis crispa TaxID=139825 RepID=A0A401GKP5_9APHY|nr:Carboxypeptidase Y homolog A [Sparassis crispa]GBE82719.1 Carboxypeptidase Y homolog A [Sparassis crispa]